MLNHSSSVVDFTTRRRKRRLLPSMSTSVRCAVILAAASRPVARRSPAGILGSNAPRILSVTGWSIPLANTALDSSWVRRWNGSISKQETRSSPKKRVSTFRSPMASSDGAAEQSPRPKKSKKLKIAEEITAENMDRLAAAFDELARKDGFDASTQYFADDATFEDDFEDDDDEDYFEEGNEMNGSLDESDDALLDPKQFQISDFATSDDTLDNSFESTEDDDDMDARIAAARSDMQSGRVTVPKALDRLAADIVVDPSVLGFRKEEDPWGIDEKHRRKEEWKKEFHLVSNALVCSACGADFQSSNEQRPGFLPAEKFATQVKLSKIEELQRLKLKADNDSEEWSPEDEVEWLIQTAGSSTAENSAPESLADMDIAAVALDMGLDLEDLAQKRVICKRCHGLQNFGTVENVLRPGWTEEPLLSQEKFRDLLRPIREKPAVIIALVDLFDFSGSVLPELDNIAGDNPVIVAANKADLLPAKMGQVRAENWVRRELEYMGVRSLANVGGAVRLVSCKTGAGVGGMLAKARELADEMDCDIYVVGAANAGKSTLLNYILGPEEAVGTPIKFRAGNRNKRKSAITTSPLPGTTLKFIKVDVGDGRSLYDTPGLLVPGTLTQLLTPDELKIVVPKNNVEPVTFRLAAGKAVLIGGLARIELIGDSRPFLFTFFVANGIKLHMTDSSKVDEFIQKHIGTILVPPLGGLDRLEQFGGLDSHVIDVEGTGWKEAAADITLTGLGWVAVTGAGMATVKVSVPKGVTVSLRPPLMPFDIWESTAKYTGSRAVRKTTKTKYGKKRKGVGRN